MRVLAVAILGGMLVFAGRAEAQCLPGTAIGCDDANPCTTDRCQLGGGCTHTLLSGPACNDGDACTEADACAAGACVGRARVCADDGFGCTEEVCGADGCMHRPVPGYCAPAPGCASATCAPGNPAHDAAGCVSEGCPPDPCSSPGTALGCNDRDPCTADRCEPGGCVHVSISGPACDDGDACTEGDQCADGGCAGVPVVCPDDGLACTDDVCVVDGCVSVPVDSRCVPAGECTGALCAPEAADRDAAGCVAGAARAEGDECAEDGDACTLDVCGHTGCRHETVLDPSSCELARDAYRQTLALGTLARELLAALGPDGPPLLRARLEAIDADLTATAQALAGRARGDDAVPPGLFETPLRRRARLALHRVSRTRPRIAGFLRTLARADVRGQIGAEAQDIGHRARLLLRGTKALEAELRRLRRLIAFFAR